MASISEGEQKEHTSLEVFLCSSRWMFRGCPVPPTVEEKKIRWKIYRVATVIA